MSQFGKSEINFLKLNCQLWYANKFRVKLAEVNEVLTEYVLNVINGVDAIKSKHQIISLFKDAETSSCSQQEIAELKIIGGAISMSYSDEADNFRPMITMNDGTRSFSMDDINQDAIAILCDAIEAPIISWMRAKLADILWIKTTDYKYGEIAVAENLNLFDEVFDETNWVACFTAISRAYSISIKLGKSTASFETLYEKVNQIILELDGNDSLFLSLNLINMIQIYSCKEDLDKYLCITNKIVEKNIQQDNINLVEKTFFVLELLLKHLKKDEEILVSKVKLAIYYEDLANKQKDQGANGIYQALSNLQKAYNIYTKLKNKDKIFQIRKKIEPLQEIAIVNMPSIPFEFDVTQIYVSINQVFEGLSSQEMIVQLGRTARIYQVENVKAQVLKQQKTFIFKSMFGNCIVDKSGHTTEYIPPLGLDDPDVDSETLFKHMVRYVTERRLFDETITLRYALQVFQSKAPCTADDLNFLINDNAIIPEGRSNIIKTGLHAGLTGKLYLAMHILLPQTEHIFRNLVYMCGDTITYLKEDGTEDYKTLSQLFKSDKLKECYNENIIFSFRSIMDEKAGSNFRNLIAHGLLDNDAGDSGVALCFLCLLIRLLSLYSISAQKITAHLMKHDSLIK